MDKKSRILGINFSTAQGRLDRQILFMLVQRAGLDICYRCGKKIERWQDFSIDHKVAWDTPEQFWDLLNIAFSHKSCNCRAIRWQPYPKRATQFDREHMRRLAKMPKGPMTQEHKDRIGASVRANLALKHSINPSWTPKT